MVEVVAVEVLCSNKVVFVCAQTVLTSSKISNFSLMHYVIIDVSISNKGWNI